jgi:hypothetical protein
VTALAIPAALMMHVAAAAQPGAMKFASASMKDGVETQGADVAANPEHFHSLIQGLSATEEKPATQPVKRDVSNVLPKTALKAVPARTEPFHLPISMSSAASEKPKIKAAKRDANNDLATSLPAAPPAKESKLPVVWSLPQIPVFPEATSLQAAAPNVGYMRKDVENDSLGGTTADNRQLPEPAGKPAAQTTAQGRSQVLPQALPQEPTEGSRMASPAADTASEATAQLSAVALEDSASAVPLARAVPTAPFGDTTTAKVAFEARLRPIQPDPATEQKIGPEAHPVPAGTVSPAASADPISPLDTATTAKARFEASPQPIPPDPATAQKIVPEPCSVQAGTLLPAASKAPIWPSNQVATDKAAFEVRPRPISPAPATEQDIEPEPRSDPAHTVSPDAMQTSAIEPQDSQSVDHVASMAPAAPFGEVTTAELASEPRQRPVFPVQAPESSPFRQPAQEPPNTARPTPVAVPVEKQNDSQRDQPERQPKAARLVAEAQSTPEVAPHLETAPSAAANSMAASLAAHVPAAPIASAPVPSPPASHTTATDADVTHTSDPPPEPAAANDIKIALNDNGQRVELRVTERAGDIHVTVRTPDSQLATAMREDLPALSSRLEQSGLHSDMWRPPASPGGENRAIETLGGNATSDPHEQPGGRQQQDGRQQDPRNPQQTLNRKSDRKEFSWLFESIR